MARRLFLGLVACAVLGHAHWFFGNLYEGLVLAPGWTSVAGGPLTVADGLLAPGSPVRYYIPITPLTVLVTLAAVAAGRRTARSTRRALLIGLALTIAGAAVTGYLVTRINLELFFDTATTPGRRAVLADRWTTWNYLRLVTVGGALAFLTAAWWTAVAGPRPGTPGASGDSGGAA